MRWQWLVMCAAVLATPAAAKEVDGRIGFGAEGSPRGGTAVHTTYWISQQVGIQGALGLAIRSSSGFGSSAVAVFGVSGLYNLVEHDTINLTAQLSVGLAAGDASVIRLSPGLRPELFLSDDFSLHTSLGLAVVLGDGSGVLGSNIDGTAISVGPAGLTGGVGFTFYR